MIIDAATLAAAVRVVMPATRAGHIPVLKGVRMESVAGGTTIVATDLDLTIGTTIDVEGNLPACVVPASLLAAWLEGCVGRIGLTVENADLVLTSDTGTMHLRTLPLDDWPKCEQADGDPAKLDRRIAGILHAASRDQARPILNGVGFGDGWACCTDSYQLAAIKVDGVAEAIVPVRALELALKGEGDATMTLDDRRCTIDIGATSYTSRLIEGRFPTWQLLCGVPKAIVTLDRERTIAALERMLVLAEAETPVRVTPTSEGLSFTVTSRDVGEIVERIDGGDELGGEYGFRPRLLLNMLRPVDTAKVDVGVTDHLHPVSVGGLDSGAVALVMPVRLT